MTHFQSLDPSKSLKKRIRKLQSVSQQIAIEQSFKMRLFANTLGLTLTPEDIAHIQRVASRICRLRYCGFEKEQQRKLARLSAGLLPIRIIEAFSQIVHYNSKDPKHQQPLELVSGSMASSTLSLSGATGVGGDTVQARAKLARAPHNQRISLYSAHDNTIMALMSHMGFNNWPIPEFASALVFELWQDADTEEYSVKFAYNAETGSSDASRGEFKYVVMPNESEKVVDWNKAVPGSMTWNYFESILMNHRGSFRNEREWMADSGIQGGYEEDMVITAGLTFDSSKQQNRRPFQKLEKITNVFFPSSKKATFTTANSKPRPKSSSINPDEDNISE
eukprot:c3649_g1_i2.p2 GENE.c3649_g1_i2~~c3649_g1_i2.p2  ORF type:complete len:335 (-),score=82.20 c3649_g1_i2:88-1092(-)